MNKFLLTLSGLMLAVSATAAPQALYVMKDGNCTKYNFGVAGDLHFTDNGHKLRISGYNDIINLDQIDYITFNAPVGATGLTSYEQKEKMVKVGEAVNALIDLNNISGIINMQDAFFAHHEVGDDYICPPSEYEVPEDYRNVHQSVRGAMKAVKDFVNGDIAALRSLRNKAMEIYKASDYFGIYEADSDDEVWVKKGGAEYLEIRYKGYNKVNYSVKLTCDSNVATWSVDNVSVEIPVKMTVVFCADAQQVAEVVLATDMKQNEKIGMELTFTAGKYKVVETLDITNPLMSEIVKVFVDGKESISSNVRVYGANLVDYDIMKDDVKEATHYHDEDGNCCGEDVGPLIAHFYRGVADVDVLGMLQVKAQGLGFSQLYDLYTELDDVEYIGGYDNYSFNSDKSVLTYHYSSKDELAVLENITTHYNTYHDAQFFYDGDKTLQGFLTFELEEDPYEDNYDHDWMISNGVLYPVYVGHDYDYKDGEEIRRDYYYTYIDGEKCIVAADDVIHTVKLISIDDIIEPRLTFPDMTSYAYEDFFDEISFKKLITDYEDLLDTYNSITGQK